MNLHEYQSKRLFADFGIPVPRGIPAETADAAVAAAEELGGKLWVVKAQVHAGGRGKAGGVKLARSTDEVREHAESMLGKQLVNSRGYVARFNFSGGDQQKKVGVLSGGERNRVHLAKIMREESNVLLLDEPTNDLDVNTLRALEEALENFGGCAVVISHDRWFLDRIATHILAFEGDSQVVWYEGNYSEYEEDRKRRLGKDADQPHRIRYRNLTRQ